MKTKSTPPIVSDHGLLFCDGQLLGYIIQFEGALYDPDGQVEGITPAQAWEHNRILSQGLIDSMDRCCEVGQTGAFYLRGGIITTFTDETVSADVHRVNNAIHFRRFQKLFRGHLVANSDLLRFRRIA